MAELSKKFYILLTFGRDINELIRTAEARGAKFEAKQSSTGGEESLNDRSAKAYYKEFKKVSYVNISMSYILYFCRG